MESNKRWYKNYPTDKVWWLDNGDEVTGMFIFSFDRQKEFNLFMDYPKNLTENQKKIFDAENPFWVEYFGG